MRKVTVGEVVGRLYESLEDYAWVPVSLTARILGLPRTSVNELIKKKRLEKVVVTDGDEGSWKGIQVSSLVAYLRDTAENKEALLPRIKELLEAAGRKGNLVNYSELMACVGMTYKNPHYRRLIGELLGKISEESINDSGRRFMLSTLVVLKTTGQPSESYFELGRGLGAMKGGQSKDMFFRAQLELIGRHFGSEFV